MQPPRFVRPLTLGSTALLLALAGCGDRAPEGDDLSVIVVGEGRQDSGLTARLAAELGAATLIERDSAGQLVGGLASSWRFVDAGRVLILRLRPVKWSDDTPLVAEDVTASFRRAARPPSPEPGFRLAGIEAASDAAAGRRAAKLGVLAPTSRVVELRLVAPAPQLLDWLAEPGLSVRRPGRPTLARYLPVAPPAKKTVEGAAPPPLEMARRSDDASPDARPKDVTLRATRDAATAIAAFRRGAADVVVSEGLTGLLEARVQGRRDELRLDQLHGVYGWRINTQRGALADPALRRLLAATIDRAAIARSFGLAAIQPEAGLLPASLRGNPGPADLAQPDSASLQPESPSAVVTPGASIPVPAAPALAPEIPVANGRIIVAAAVAASAAPAPSGRTKTATPKTPATPAQPPSPASEGDTPLLTLQLLVPPGREHAQVAQRVAADWRALGVQLVLIEADADARAKRIARGDFDLAVDEASLAVPDAAALIDRFRCGQGPYCNDAADALLAAARMVPADQRPGQLAVVEAILRESPPFIGLFGAVRWALVSPTLDGWTSNSSGVHPLGRIGRGTRRAR